MISRFLTLSLGLVLLASCGQNNNFGDQKKSGKIISNRPQNRTQFIAIVRLKGPSLFESAKIENGRPVVTNAQKDSILAEQNQMIQKLKGLSSEIKVLKKYRFVLNAVAVLAPVSLEGKIKGLGGVSYIEADSQFGRSEVIHDNGVMKSEGFSATSVEFIGGLKALEAGIDGEGISVGVVDTGIDYTHKMFGGLGTEEAFKNIDPSGEAVGYPNEKVVGGIDLVGTEYDASSSVFEKHIPKEDDNPIDEGGHGTHVAGSVAGIGDGLKTYDGVAPKAKLHAIKVFGKNGSTGDMVIVAALEYAADPNGDLDPSDRLDVVNLSLGSGYGKPHILYSAAVKNLASAGTVVVASAGNSGHESYITGAPATTNEAISVAASIDNMEHNYKFDAVIFNTPDLENLAVESIEGSISKPIKDFETLEGLLVHVGEAATDLTDEQIAALNGNVALIDRGSVTFSEKLKRAQEAGAIAAVVANNREGDPIVMGGSERVEIAAIMITQELRNKILDSVNKGEARINFKSDKKIEKPELIDTLTNFSSRGPRSNDSLIKPEISAPGYNIVSARMGGGDAPARMSGTSMAAPHMAGVMALLKQKHPELSVKKLKALSMSTSKLISDKEGKLYPVAMQGAGRVDVATLINSKVIPLPHSFSLGEVQVASKKLLRRKFVLENVSDQELTLKITFSGKEGLSLLKEKEVVLSAKESKELELSFVLSPKTDEFTEELDGFVKIKSEEKVLAQVPVLVITKKLSQVKVESLIVNSDSADPAGASVDLKIANSGKNKGQAQIFNLTGLDGRKGKVGENNSTRTLSCDLQAVGHRVVTKEVEGQTVELLQLGVKIFNPLTRWQPCEISVLIDANGDGKAEQELAGIIHDNLSGLDGNAYNSFLLDAPKVKELRAKFEQDQQQGKDVDADYKPAIVDVQGMKVFNHSTVAIVEADLSKLAKGSNGHLFVKIATLNEDRGGVNPDDFLGDLEKKWLLIDVSNGGLSYLDIPEVVEVAGKSEKSISLTKGEGQGDLLVLFPQNKSVFSTSLKDNQLQIPAPQFLFD